MKASHKALYSLTLFHALLSPSYAAQGDKVTAAFREKKEYLSGSTLVQRYLDDRYAQDGANFNYSQAMAEANNAERDAILQARAKVGYSEQESAFKDLFNQILVGAQVEVSEGKYRFSARSIDAAKDLARKQATSSTPPKTASVSQLSFSGNTASPGSSVATGGPQTKDQEPSNLDLPGPEALSRLEWYFQRNQNNGFYNNRPNKKAADEKKIATLRTNLNRLAELQKTFDSFALSTGVTVPNLSQPASSYLLENENPFEVWKATQSGRYTNIAVHDTTRQNAPTATPDSHIVAGPQAGSATQGELDQRTKDDNYWKSQAELRLAETRAKKASKSR